MSAVMGPKREEEKKGEDREWVNKNVGWMKIF